MNTPPIPRTGHARSLARVLPGPSVLVALWGIAALLAALLLPLGQAWAKPEDGAKPDSAGTSSKVWPTSFTEGDIKSGKAVINFKVSGYGKNELVNIKIDDGNACSDTSHGACVYHQQRLDGKGAATGSFTLPTDLKKGGHWLRMLGTEKKYVDGKEVGYEGYTRRGGNDFTVTAGGDVSGGGSGKGRTSGDVTKVQGPSNGKGTGGSVNTSKDKNAGGNDGGQKKSTGGDKNTSGNDAGADQQTPSDQDPGTTQQEPGTTDAADPEDAEVDEDTGTVGVSDGGGDESGEDSEQPTTVPHDTKAPKAPVSGDYELIDLNAGGFTAKQEGSTVTVSLKDVPAGQSLYVYAYSEPQGMGWIDASKKQTASVDVSGLEAGDHKLAFVDPDGELVGWVSASNDAPAAAGAADAAAPAAGSDVPMLGIIVLGVAVVLAVVLVLFALLHGRKRPASGDQAAS